MLGFVLFTPGVMANHSWGHDLENELDDIREQVPPLPREVPPNGFTGSCDDPVKQLLCDYSPYCLSNSNSNFSTIATMLGYSFGYRAQVDHFGVSFWPVRSGGPLKETTVAMEGASNGKCSWLAVRL